MPTLPRPANLILLHPRDQRRPTTLRRRTGTPQLATRAQLLERLETIGELAPSAPLSFLVVKVRGVKETHDAATLMECAALRLRELTRATDAIGRFTGTSFGVVLQGTGATAAGAVAARLSFHLNYLLGALSPGADSVVYAATGVGLNADTLPVAALDSLGDCG